MGILVRTALYHCRSEIKNTKFYAGLILIFCAVYLTLSPITQISESYRVNMNMAIFSLTAAAPFCLSILFLAALFIFSDLPIKHPSPLFLMIRSGKRNWLFAQIIYVLLVSFFLTVFVYMALLVVSKGHLFLSDDWGKLVYSIASGQLDQAGGLDFRIDLNVIQNWTPAAAFVWTFSGLLLTFVMFGLISLVLNLFVNEFAGTICNILMTAIHLLFGFFPEKEMYWLSPIEWCSIRDVGISAAGYRPDIRFVLITRTMIFACLLVTAYLMSSKRGDLLKHMERA